MIILQVEAPQRSKAAGGLREQVLGVPRYGAVSVSQQVLTLFPFDFQITPS